MIALGNTIIGKIYLGNNEVKKVYKGDNIIFDSKPYDAEIEYLESDGNQWIDTLLYGDKNTEVQIDFIPYENNKSIGFSRGDNTNDINLYITNSGNGGNQRFGNRAVLVKYTVGNRYNVILRNTKLFVNEEEYTFTASASFTTPTTLQIFKTNTYIKAKVFATKILKNNIVVFDGIPVRVGQIGYMYDKVSGQLFGNSGTGSFILGNDI